MMFLLRDRDRIKESVIKKIIIHQRKQTMSERISFNFFFIFSKFEDIFVNDQDMHQHHYYRSLLAIEIILHLNYQ